MIMSNKKEQIRTKNEAYRCYAEIIFPGRAFTGGFIDVSPE